MTRTTISRSSTASFSTGIDVSRPRVDSPSSRPWSAPTSPGRVDPPSDRTRTRPERARYVLPELGFDPAALEPFCSAETIELHHGRHHAAHVAGANRALDRLALARQSDDWTSINQLEADLSFHVSGHVLHSIFWSNLAPDVDDRPIGEVAAAIDDCFGSFDEFRQQFAHAAAAVQGSGWAALAWEPVARCLVVEQIHDHQSTITRQSDVLLLCDVWEHAYYVSYRNRRAEWIDAFWHLVNWTDVERRFAAALNRAPEARPDCRAQHPSSGRVPMGLPFIWPEYVRRAVR
jgi:superoxide dismutase, Fe-Mn family